MEAELRFGNRLEADPAPGKAGKRKAVKSEIQIVLQRCRVENRHQCRGEHLLALVCKGGGLAAMIVAGQSKHTAMPRRTSRIRVL